MRSDDEVISQFRFLAAFLWVSAVGVGGGGGVGVGRRMQGHQEMVSFWSSGSRGPGTGGEELETKKFATVSVLGFIVFVGLWLWWSWSEESRSF